MFGIGSEISLNFRRVDYLFEQVFDNVSHENSIQIDGHGSTTCV